MPDDSYSMPSPQSDCRLYLHTGEHNLLFASWPGDHSLDRVKRDDADLRRALVRVNRTCECAAFARKKVRACSRSRSLVLLSPNTIETVLNKDDPGTARVPLNMYVLSGGAKLLADDAPHGCEYAL